MLLQLSDVQELPSLQERLPLPTQTPPEHWSVGVHAFPSLQEAELFV